MDRTSLNRIENGRQPYNKYILEDLAVFYNCEVWQLIAIDPFDDDTMLELYKILSHATENEKQRALRAMKAVLDIS